MSNVPWLTLLGALPLLGALVVLVLPRGSSALARPIALATSLVVLVVGIVMTTRFDFAGTGSQFQLTETHRWIPQIGASYALGVDGISLALILMSIILVPICLVAAWNDVDPADGRRVQTYMALMLVLESLVIGVFAARDVFLFYVFFEAMLIPVYFLIGMFGGPRRQYAAVKFLLFSLAGGLVMLVAVIGVYLNGPRGEQGFLVENLTGVDFGTGVERWLFLGFFIAFAVKAPMVPVHTWLPDAASQARPATATLLVGVLDKVGTFGMIRYCLQMFPEASRWATPVVITLAVISILYAAVVAIGQDDIMRLIAYTSVSHFGFIVLGIFAFTQTAGVGSSLYMVNHGFTTAALFLFAGMLIARRGSSRISDFGGWQRVTPALAGCFLIAGLSGLALPGLNSFISEFLVMLGSFQRYQVATVFAVIGVVLAALYILLMYKRMMTGPAPKDLIGKVPDMNGREKLVAAPLIALFLFLGFFPKPALDLIRPAVATTLQIVNVTDPAPTGTVEGSNQ